MSTIMICSISYPNWCELLFEGINAMLWLFNENVLFTKQSHLCSVMSEQPIELSLVKIELMSEIIALCKSEL